MEIKIKLSLGTKFQYLHTTFVIWTELTQKSFFWSKKRKKS